MYAILDEDDARHHDATRWFVNPERETEPLITHNYVVVEAASLVHRRLGAALVRRLFNDILPVVSVTFVDVELHSLALAAHLATLCRRSSFVDRVSFEFMRREAIGVAFAFDDDFAEEGFTLVP